MLSAGVQPAELKRLIGGWTAREYAARQLADEAVDEKQTLHIAGVCAEAVAAHPTAVSIECWHTGGNLLQMGDILDAHGNVLGQVSWADSRIDCSIGTDRPVWDAAFDPFERRIDIANAVRIAQSRPAPEPLRPSMAEARIHVQLADAISEEAHLAWQQPDRDDITEGTLRHGVWTEDGQLSPAGTDPRDGHVRITTRTGGELYVLFSDLAASRASGDLAWRS